MPRRKLRWILVAPDGEQLRTGLSFGAFDDRSAWERARATADRVRAVEGAVLRVYVDGREITPHDAPSPP